jgi:cytochrome b561
MSDRHHPLTISLHWLTLLLVFAGVACVLLRELVEDRDLRLLLLELHRNAGLLVLLVTSLRLFSRWPLAAHRINAGLPPPLHLAAKLGHGLLYLSLAAIPMLGWALSSARGQTVNLFGWLPLPALLGRDRDLAESLEAWHGNLAWALIALVSLHAAAALWHHYGRRDGVLRSMLPALRKPSSPTTP